MHCPECGEPARGTVERVYGIALLDEEAFTYAGETDVDWNSQESVLGTDGKPILECSNVHQWPAPADWDPDA